MSEQSMKELLEQEDMPDIQERTVVKGVVVQVSRDEAYVDIGYKQEIPVSKRDLAVPAPDDARDVVKVGDEIDVYIKSLGGDNGGSLSKVEADKMAAWKDIEVIQANGDTVEAKIAKEVKGGLVAYVMGLRGFIPASQMELHFVKDLSVYVDQTVEAEIIEVDVQKRRLVLSRRKLLERDRAEKEEAVFSAIEPEQVVRGTVKRLVDYGAFIDIGGVDGLAHISDLAWHRVKHPSEVLEVGQELDVYVKSVDREAKRISLSVKDTLPDPWVEKAAQYAEGDFIEGKIIKLTDFGAFMEIEPGFDGLIRWASLLKSVLSVQMRLFIQVMLYWLKYSASIQNVSVFHFRSPRQSAMQMLRMLRNMWMRARQKRQKQARTRKVRSKRISIG